MSSSGRWIQAFGTCEFLIYILMLLIFNIGIILFQWFLAKYTDGNFPNIEYELVLLLGLGSVLLIAFAGTIAFSIGLYKSSVNVYSNLVRAILKRPMEFFDTTAIG